MLKQVALIALMGMSASAMAGEWQVKVGGSVISPTADTSLNTLIGPVNVEADHEYAFTPSVEYFFNDNISAELLLATPISHDVLVNGDNGAKIKHLPPTLTAKYHFKNSTRFTPYIGVGGTAFIAWDEEGVVKDVKEDFGFAGQIGFNFQPADAKNWGVFFDARYAQLSPEVTLTADTAAALGAEKFDLDIDPMVYTIGYSYKF
ncbi:MULTISPECIES: OmpW/AlkL family protein [Acinetobacter]|jgi:outer membrane protein|uniref:OmpW/AlkL family protein n=1 Tax=Acinetobacter TaxID=469 RepID=UPI0015D1A9DF|nr:MULTISPECIES: OmpW family outer membrane protein [Acinetobacter]MBF4521798.1 outer membrane beta-barrel protein [Acinetobacter towneri]